MAVTMFRNPLMTLVVSLCLLVGCAPAEHQRATEARSASGLAYELAGEGPLVVLIHGTNLDRRMWDDEITWLKEHARVIRYDLRGQGASDFPTEAYSNHTDLLELLDELGEEEASLIGLSAGAQVALNVALEAPHRVQRMVLVSPSLTGYVPEVMPSFVADLSSALQAGDFEQANEVLLASPIMEVPPSFADRVQAMVKQNSRLWTIPYALVKPVSPAAIERLEEIRPPALVLIGENDIQAIQAQGALLKQRLADARLITVPNGGHLLNMTSPETFRDAVSAFLDVPED